MKSIPRFMLYALAVQLLLSQTACTQPDALKEDLSEIMVKHQAVGVSYAVVKDGKLVYTDALGYRDLDAKEPLEETDVFRIASISKSFVATGILQLVEAGLLSLDDDVSDLIGFPILNPNFPETAITLRMILSHTSSISDANGYFSLDGLQADKSETWEKSFHSYAPGEGYRYCNLNFNLAGAILEKYSGTRFDRHIKEKISEPLGLYAHHNVDELDSTRFALIYEYDTVANKFTVSNAYPSLAPRLADYTIGYSAPVFSPTGGMKISAPDLARYMIMHMNYGISDGVRIISEESSKAMQTPLSDEEQYGLALWKTDKLVEGETLVGHTGSAYGLYSAMFFHPEKRFGIVVLTNGSHTDYTDEYHSLIRDVVNSLYQHLIAD